MGISFDRDLRVAGYRASTFKNALIGYLRTKSPASLIDLKSVFPHRRDGAIVYEECLDRHLIDRATGKVTEAGLTLVRSKVVPRTPLEKAKGVLDAFLERVDELNRDPEAISRVDQVWLFGSLMRDESTVGDIDLAIARSSSGRFENLDAQVLQAKALLANFPDAPRDWAWPWDRIDWLYRRAIFGARRHPLLAGAKDGVDDLASLGVPCRLIYERARGGRVDDAIVPRHPQSNGRLNTIDPLPVAPDLTPAPLQPMDARWVAGYDRWGSVSPYDIFRGWTDECRRLFPEYPRDLRIAASGDDLRDFPWRPKTIKRPGIDGRAAIAVISATEFWGTCITLRRSIYDISGKTVLEASFSDLQLHRSRKYIDLATLPEMVSAVSLILAVDAERILRRATDRDSSAGITIQIVSGDLPDDMKHYFVGEIVKVLEQRTVAIEPAGLSKSVVIELI
ncbi:hypothetical protein [uncultured Sphingomonas sp.]|uniref:hypothetical protein n=1 Tax=uncultured Sphingomonas sp. TaxID=158754 RepID=UPI00260D9BBB|nr:hypothetical protein [uncultured Sphingomonas sp.]